MWVGFLKSNNDDRLVTFLLSPCHDDFYGEYNWYHDSSSIEFPDRSKIYFHKTLPFLSPCSLFSTLVSFIQGLLTRFLHFLRIAFGNTGLRYYFFALLTLTLLFYHGYNTWVWWFKKYIEFSQCPREKETLGWLHERLWGSSGGKVKFDQIIKEDCCDIFSPCSEIDSESSSSGSMGILMEMTGSFIDKEVLSYDHNTLDDNYISKLWSNIEISSRRCCAGTLCGWWKSLHHSTKGSIRLIFLFLFRGNREF